MDDLVVLEDFFVGSGLVVVGSNGVVSVMVYVICRWWSSFLISYSNLNKRWSVTDAKCSQMQLI